MHDVEQYNARASVLKEILEREGGRMARRVLYNMALEESESWFCDCTWFHYNDTVLPMMKRDKMINVDGDIIKLEKKEG